MKVIKWYADVTVIVNGALDEEERFYDPETADQFILETQGDLSRDYLKSDIENAQIFTLEHSHMPRECVCVQYLTDHDPVWSIGDTSEGPVQVFS